jgi:hypothetical protein
VLQALNRIDFEELVNSYAEKQGFDQSTDTELFEEVCKNN